MTPTPHSVITRNDAQHEADLRQATSHTTLTRQQIQALIEECADIATDLHHAEPAGIAATYHKLGLRLTYHPDKHLIRAAACPTPTNIGKRSVSEGGLDHYAHALHQRKLLVVG